MTKNQMPSIMTGKQVSEDCGATGIMVDKELVQNQRIASMMAGSELKVRTTTNNQWGSKSGIKTEVTGSMASNLKWRRIM